MPRITVKCEKETLKRVTQVRFDMNIEKFMPAIVGLILGALVGWGLGELLNAVPFISVPRIPLILIAAGLSGFIGFLVSMRS